MDIRTNTLMYLNSLDNKHIKKSNMLSDKSYCSKTSFKQDEIEFSNTGMQLIKHKSSTSEAEKIRNRERIDFADGTVTFDVQTRIFCLPDGSQISADDVAATVDYDKVYNLKVSDNKLILKQDAYYSYTDKNSNISMFSSSKVLSSHSIATFCLNNEMENPSRPLEAINSADILGALMEYKSPGGAYIFHSHKEVKNLLEHLGFKPGKIEIGIEGSFKSTYFFTHDGELYAEYESEARIRAINSTNHLERGVPAGSIWRIDGNEYPMDENGYFHIPSGIMCVPGEMEIVDSQGNPVTIKNA